MLRNLSRPLFAASLLGAALCACTFSALADVKLPVIFSHNMVLQQGVQVPVWGWADEGETVTVKFGAQSLTTKAKDGRWAVKLKPLTAGGGPDALVISGKNRIRLENVVVGEVWVCSGQSNMEWPLVNSFESKADIEKSANSDLRLFTVQKTKSQDPLDDLKQPWNVTKFAWQESSALSSPDFSAVAYYFGRELQKSRGVPVGLIHTSWGGSPAEAWMSREVLFANTSYFADIVEKADVDWKKYEENAAKYAKEAADAKKAGTKPGNPPRMPWRTSELYNGMIHPLIPFAIKGAIWYQGESNAGRAQQYRTLFPDMIKNWRKDWGQGDFPFLFVQLAPYMPIKTDPGDSSWAELRDAQQHTLRTLTKTGMAVITDVGEQNDIHPKKKQPVGERLAIAARAVAYGERITPTGPLYKSMKVKADKTLGERIIVSFDNIGGGLEVKGNELKGFAICGDDKKWVWAKAEVLPDNTVAVSSPDVKKPVAVRFGWADFPVVNLFNKDGLPASPFRTDDFPVITK